jgi:membrane-bound transcription factor site-1 protease
MDKIREVSASGITIVSAIGNDGPLHGTLNNPADMIEVVGVGGAESRESLWEYSSRGMTTWEFPSGIGRVKPDVLALSSLLQSSSLKSLGEKCAALSGTSFASPIIAGVLALLASSKESKRLNPAMSKQALIELSTHIDEHSLGIFDQGNGLINLDKLNLDTFVLEEKVTTIPASLNLLDDCPFLWPFCSHSLFATSMPLVVNFTVLNSKEVDSAFSSAPVWVSDSPILDVKFGYSEQFWPWSGYLSAHFSVHEDLAPSSDVYVKGSIHFILSDSNVRIPVSLKVIKTPPRESRLIWDQFHNIQYPSGFFPKDDLNAKNQVLDWNGDHMYTNFRELYDRLMSRGYYVDILHSEWTCFNASNYAALIIMDAEEEFFEKERSKLVSDVLEKGLSIILFAEWYNIKQMEALNFKDSNTEEVWTPQTGGANIPSLNDFLLNFGIAFGDTVWRGDILVAGQRIGFLSGSEIIAFPKKGLIHTSKLLYFQEKGWKRTSRNPAVLGLYKPEFASSGRVIVYGDSDCIDSANKNLNGRCFSLFDHLLIYAIHDRIHPKLRDSLTELEEDFRIPGVSLPVRRSDVNFMSYSKVFGKEFQGICRFEESNSSLASLRIDPVMFPSALPESSLDSMFSFPPLLAIMFLSGLILSIYMLRRISRHRRLRYAVITSGMKEV